MLITVLVFSDMDILTSEQRIHNQHTYGAGRQLALAILQ